MELGQVHSLSMDTLASTVRDPSHDLADNVVDTALFSTQKFKKSIDFKL